MKLKTSRELRKYPNTDRYTSRPLKIQFYFLCFVFLVFLFVCFAFQDRDSVCTYDGLELTIFLSQPHRCLDCRGVPSHLAGVCFAYFNPWGCVCVCVYVFRGECARAFEAMWGNSLCRCLPQLLSRLLSRCFGWFSFGFETGWRYVTLTSLELRWNSSQSSASLRLPGPGIKDVHHKNSGL